MSQRAFQSGSDVLAEGVEQEALARLRAVVETAVDGIITIDECGLIETVNPAAARIFGYEARSLIGRNLRVLMPEPYHSEHDAYIKNYLTTGERKIIGIGREVRGRRQDGTEFPMELAVSETRLGDKLIFTGIVRDVSERCRAEQAMGESEARFRMMANCTPALIWMSGVDKRCTWFNQRWLEFTGRTLDQELGDGWIHGIHQDDRERSLQVYHAAFDARGPFEIEYRLRRFDGEYRWMRDAGAPIHLQDGAFAGYIGSCVDVTEQKLGEEELLERVAQRTRELAATNAQLRQQVEERQRVESLIAVDNRILEMIAAGVDQTELLTAICQATEELLPGHRCAVCIISIPSKDPAEATAALEARPHLVNTYSVTGESSVLLPLRLDREIVPVITAQDAAGIHPYLDAIRSYWHEPIFAPGEKITGTVGVYCPEEGAPDEFALSVTAAAARLAGIAVERARGEARARDQLAYLAHVSRLATMGEMASGLAHELNQPLCAIVNYTEACAELVNRSEEAKKRLPQALKEVARQAERAGEVIRRLREFVKRREPQRQPVDINKVVRDVVALTNVETRHSDVRTRVKLAKRPPKVFADSIQIEQVLVNLVRNACEAMQEAQLTSRKLTIETLRRRGAMEVTVGDSGPGIPKEIQSRLFDAFVTTKQNGMGMGLSISQSILEAHEGRIWATSNYQGGTTFRFLIPTAWRVQHDRRNRARR